MRLALRGGRERGSVWFNNADMTANVEGEQMTRDEFERRYWEPADRVYEGADDSSRSVGIGISVLIAKIIRTSLDFCLRRAYYASCKRTRR
jgi:hypothetical protein